MPTLKVNSSSPVELHYEDFGSGDPVVLIHGWPLSGRSWEGQVVAFVEAGHRVITYDRRGFGDSSQPWDGYDYDTFAADLDALLSHLDLHRVTLVGFSMGGGEVVRYIATYGTDRIAQAVLASAVPPYLAKTDDNPDGAIDDATAQGFLTGVAEDRPAFLAGFFEQFFGIKGALGVSQKVSDEQVHYATDIALFASPRGTSECIKAFGTTDFRSEMSAITVPTLVIHGDSDMVVPFEASGKRAAEAIANSELVLIEGGPHGVNASHTDEWNQAVLAFVAKKGAALSAAGAGAGQSHPFGS